MLQHATNTKQCLNGSIINKIFGRLRRRKTLDIPSDPNHPDFACAKCSNNQCIYKLLACYICLLRRRANYVNVCFQNNWTGWDYKLNEKSKLLKHTQHIPNRLNTLIQDNFWDFYDCNSRVILSLIDSYHLLEGKQLIGTVASTFLISLKMNKFKDLYDNDLIFESKNPKPHQKPGPKQVVMPHVYTSPTTPQNYGVYSLDSIYNMLWKVREALSEDYMLWLLTYRYFQYLAEQDNLGYLIDVNNTKYIKWHGDVKNLSNMILTPSPLSSFTLIESQFKQNRLSQPRDSQPIDQMISRNSWQPKAAATKDSLTQQESQLFKTYLLPSCLTINNKPLNKLPYHAPQITYNPFGCKAPKRKLKVGYKSLANNIQTYNVPSQPIDITIVNNPYDFIDDYKSLLALLSIYNSKLILFRLHNCNPDILTWWTKNISLLGYNYNIINSQNKLKTIVIQ